MLLQSSGILDWLKGEGLELAKDVGIKLLIAVSLFIIGGWIIKRLVRVLDNTLKKRNVDDTLRPFLKSFVGATLRILLIIVIISTLGVEMTSIVAVLASAALAVGLALQGSLANLAGGVILLVAKPFKKEDLIEAQGTLGVVKEIGILATTLTTLDNRTVFIPNGPLAGGTITNYTHEDLRRVDMTIGIGYSDDINKAREIILGLVKESPLCLEYPESPEPTTVAVHELADSSVNFTVRVWCKTPDYWDVYWYINENVKKTFDSQGVGIPFPQMDLHVHQPA